jgi:hypothetical protein
VGIGSWLCLIVPRQCSVLRLLPGIQRLHLSWAVGYAMLFNGPASVLACWSQHPLLLLLLLLFSFPVITTCTGSASWLGLATLVHSPAGAVAAMLLGSLSTACSDVVVDSLVVERARGEPLVSAWLCKGLRRCYAYIMHRNSCRAHSALLAAMWRLTAWEWSGLEASR